MRIAFQKWLIVASLTLAIGGHWVMLQSVAWIGMAVSYSQTAPISEALLKTFDGKHPCKLCKVVQAGKGAEQKSDSQRVDPKLDFFLVARQVIILSPPPVLFQRADIRSLAARSKTPPTPPPRSLPG